MLFLHGFPETSYMWRDAMRVAVEAGWHCVAPDLPGYGDSPRDGPGTWERHLEAIGRFTEEMALGPVVLAVHDWGGLIGLAWACEHPDEVRALVISDTGFFADGRWHGMAQALRTEGQGEEMIAAMNRDLLAATLRQSSPAMDDAAIDEYWKGLADEDARVGVLEFYRSMDFEKLGRYDGQLARLGVPALLVWGAKDEFAPVAGAHRFAKELADTDLVVLDDAGHFVWEDDPQGTGEALARFLERLTS